MCILLPSEKEIFRGLSYFLWKKKSNHWMFLRIDSEKQDFSIAYVLFLSSPPLSLSFPSPPAPSLSNAYVYPSSMADKGYLWRRCGQRSMSAQHSSWNQCPSVCRANTWVDPGAGRTCALVITIGCYIHDCGMAHFPLKKRKGGAN